MAKTDIMKETVTMSIRNTISLGEYRQTTRPEISAQSTSSIINDLVDLRRKQAGAQSFDATLDLTLQDRFASLRGKLSSIKDQNCMEGILSTSKFD